MISVIRNPPVTASNTSVATVHVIVKMTHVTMKKMDCKAWNFTNALERNGSTNRKIAPLTAPNA